MAQFYFHCSNSQTMLVDQRGTAVRDLIEARDHAASVVWSLAMLRGPQDLRDWVVHVSDDFDDEIFEVSFSSVLGKPN